MISLISGVVADKGFFPLPLALGLLLGAAIGEIAIFLMGRSSKVSNKYLKPGTFLAYALCLGAVVGNMFLMTEARERKMYV